MYRTTVQYPIVCSSRYIYIFFGLYLGPAFLARLLWILEVDLVLTIMDSYIGESNLDLPRIYIHTCKYLGIGTHWSCILLKGLQVGM